MTRNTITQAMKGTTVTSDLIPVRALSGWAPHGEIGVIARQFEYIAQEQGLDGDGEAHHKSIDAVVHPLPAAAGLEFILVDDIRDHDLQQDHQSGQADTEKYPGDEPPDQIADKPIGDQSRPRRIPRRPYRSSWSRID